MNEGLNAVTLVDGEYPTTTPYTLAKDLQKAVVAGFIIESEGKPKAQYSLFTHIFEKKSSLGKWLLE